MSDREQSVVDLNEQVLGSLATLRNLLGEGITLSASLIPQLGAVRVDPSAFREAILHVVANARKSMPNGGTIHIETENISLAARHVELGVAPGEYVCLTLSNTCTMITPEVVSLHFPSDSSMGLFLAPVYAFAKRFGGTATIRCEPDQGTAVSLYLPAI
jgi:signal transduction histidine kinase